jgi:preprotein translocase subunit SecY
MWETLRNAWRVDDLRKKILYTFFMLLLFRLVGVIPAPGVDINAVNASLKSSTLPLLDLVNMMTGNAFGKMTIMAMGITPYINSSIIMQLLTIAIPALERMQKEGEEGRKRIATITRYVTVGLAVIQALGLVGNLGYIKPGWFNYVLVGLSMAGGTSLAMWIGERITEKGVGNGISLLIFAGIVNNLFTGFVSGVAGANTTSAWLSLILILLAAVVMITLITFIDMGERRIPVQYAKRVVGRKMYGGQSTHIPMRVNSVGMLPLIFAYSFMAFPGTIIQLIGGTKSGIYTWWSAYMRSTSPAYMIITALLIIAFTYFYTSISFNPQDISKNVQQQGGLIPGIRSGKATVDFLQRTSSRLTLFGALFLATLATIPTILTINLQQQVPFAASSLIIAVSVALETTRQMESQLTMRHYKGFL